MSTTEQYNGIDAGRVEEQTPHVSTNHLSYPLDQTQQVNAVNNEESKYQSGRTNEESSNGLDVADFANLDGAVIPIEQVHLAKQVKIEVIEGFDQLDKSTALLINAQGLEGSLRGKRDGCTIIGSGEHGQNGEPINDFIIPQDELGIGKRHLIIKYNSDNGDYCMRDLGDGSGTFVRLDIPLVLKHGFIISFGDSHMIVNFYQAQASEGNYASNTADRSYDKIQLKFIDGPKTDKTYEFNTSQKIQIGRMPYCDIQFDDNQLSRLQCKISFTEDGNWVLHDGDGAKLSTNGTWLFVDELFSIYDNMIFKAGQTLFRASLLNPTGKK